MRERRSALGERIAAAGCWTAALLVTLALAALLGDVVRRGAGRLSLHFLVAAPERAGRAGGIGTVLVSTLLIIGLALVAAVPISLGTAIFLAERTRGGRIGRAVRGSLDALAAVPSIVFGLFGNALFCHLLGFGFSILSGGLTLAVMTLPVLIRTTEEALHAIPLETRLAAAALGFRRGTTLTRVLLPAAAPGIGAGIVLAVGRAASETAALIFTSGYVTRMPSSLLDSGRALSVHVYDLAMNVPGGDANAYAAALVLVGVLLLLNGAALRATRGRVEVRP